VSEHYTRNTESVTRWCNRCGRPTQHLVSAGRVGRCENDHHPATPGKPPRANIPPLQQPGLFAGALAPQLSESLQATALRELAGAVCVCGSAKRRAQSFCGPCYYALPVPVRNSLWAIFSQGYAVNYDAAKDWLRHNTNRLDQRRPA